MTNIALESKLRSVERSSLNPGPRTCVVIELQSSITPGLPAQLVLELNVGTVASQYEQTRKHVCTICLHSEHSREMKNIFNVHRCSMYPGSNVSKAPGIQDFFHRFDFIIYVDICNIVQV